MSGDIDQTEVGPRIPGGQLMILNGTSSTNVCGGVTATLEGVLTTHYSLRHAVPQDQREVSERISESALR